MQFFHVIFVVFTTVINTNIILNLMFLFPNCSTRLGVNIFKDTFTPNLSVDLGSCFSKSMNDVHAENSQILAKPWPKFWFEIQIPKSLTRYTSLECMNCTE